VGQQEAPVTVEQAGFWVCIVAGLALLVCAALKGAGILQ